MMTLRPKQRTLSYIFQTTPQKDTLPLGPRVTLTALARISTPLRILALPSFENLISLCAPRINEGVETLLTALAAARRRDLDDVVDRRCIVPLFLYISEEMDGG